MALLNTMLNSIPFLATISENVSKPKGFWELLLLNVFGFIKDYGWRIIAFIVILKLILLPLDIFQRYKMRKNAKITEALKPQVDKLKHQYAGDAKMLSAKQMELNKKAGFSYFSSCIPMILTLVIFITLFSGMRSISQYMIFRQYSVWYDVYSTAIIDYEEVDPDFKLQKQAYEASIAEYNRIIDELESQDDYDIEQLIINRAALQQEEASLQTLLYKAEDYAQDKVVEYNDDNADSFYWIKSLWQPDVTWAKPIHSSKGSFQSSVGDYAKLNKDKGDVGRVTLSDMLDKYDKVTEKLVNSSNNKENGYFILVIASFLLSIGSQFITQRLQKKSGQLTSGAAMGGGTLKFMIIIMPVVVAIFALQYTAAFALYMVVNSAMGIIINVCVTLLMNLYDKKQAANSEGVVVAYGRPDPNSSKNIPKKGKNSNQVLRHGRPDPNRTDNSNNKTDKNNKK